MGLTREREQLKGFLTYILGRNPYEFGLVPDENGYVKIKDLLKVMNEEEGWGHVKQQSINELIIALPDPGIEIEDNQIRSTDRENLLKPALCETTPRLLFSGIRNKAHGHVLENGILPYDNLAFVVLSSEKSMAERIAQRKDPQPIIVTVNTRDAENLGVMFFLAGGNLYLARHIPLNSFTAPPLPSFEENKWKSDKKKAPVQKTAPMPGSFIPDFGGNKNKKQKGEKEDRLSWKHNKKKIRRQKDSFRDEF